VNLTYEEELGDTKGLVKVPKSKKDRQHNGQNKSLVVGNYDLMIYVVGSHIIILFKL
jgi:hypothetical protein